MFDFGEALKAKEAEIEAEKLKLARDNEAKLTNIKTLHGKAKKFFDSMNFPCDGYIREYELTFTSGFSGKVIVTALEENQFNVVLYPHDHDGDFYGRFPTGQNMNEADLTRFLVNWVVPAA